MSQDVLIRRVEQLERDVEILKRYHVGSVRRDAIQYVAMLVTLAVTLFGSAGFLGWQNTRLLDQMEKRIDQMEKRIDERITNLETRLDDRTTALETRMDQVERNLIARFEDLRQVVLNQQGQPQATTP